ncbi:NDP-hexose 2,3-dehydratase family protein [Streptomyces sp. AV19]|uniref:NDP-hexose 2,3-dehydratase family protein n=1 Tax=Streptomyces sp. AV19 TaxID=2793068 RepID=UPI0018FE4441|nr:NDP-hexose 2,3-dehydratase family protein [Streptomyces sp. AV19]MBH1937772.1 NDP-hexose 2,3-dehydratase family protein [Streptomyces sp. AV19]MDG4533660.1 NDP-hexose 2,3-dehydratase family protein [Streptomyces sp. AV19]
MTLSTAETADPDSFLEERSASSNYRVERVPLEALPDWRIDDCLRHASGRFFAVEGLSVRTDFGPTPQWCQPIIVQPEIGILGIIVKRINGVHHFLMQAKMEPGNSRLVQYAATVQATPSNYQRVHGGRPTPYLEYFQEHTGRRIVFDQLLSEHASWYLYKRNRNMIIEIPENEDIAVADDFTWLTLGQLRHQLEQGNRVNMNARTVLSGVSYAAEDAPDSYGEIRDAFRLQVVESHNAGRSDADVSATMTWLIDQKAKYSLDVRRISLCDMDEWVCGKDSIRHREDRYFRIIGLSVAATSREVGTWWQPMLEPTGGNAVALICQRRSGVLQFLVQAMIQPGLTDRLELAATVQLTPGSYSGPEDFPPLAEYLDAPESWLRLKAVQSEDGGRFSRADTTHVVVNVPDGHTVDAPDNYRWMTLGLLNRLICSGYYVNVEARSLIACLV